MTQEAEQVPVLSTYYRPDVEYYDSVQEILEEDDLIETDIVIAGWNRKLRIRSLTFEQMTRINQKATDAKGVLNEREFVLQTLIEGVIRPKINQVMAEKLVDKNGSILQSLADDIWDLGRISKKVFDGYIDAIKKSEAQKQAEKK